MAYSQAFHSLEAWLVLLQNMVPQDQISSVLRSLERKSIWNRNKISFMQKTLNNPAVKIVGKVFTSTH